jgi:hypothetical protein
MGSGHRSDGRPLGESHQRFPCDSAEHHPDLMFPAVVLYRDRTCIDSDAIDLG